MKYDIVWSCGHEGTVELFGKVSDRERKIQYYKDCCKCEECRKKDAEQIEKPGFKPIEMFYGEYKENYSKCETRPYSYDKEKKTIVVFIPDNPETEAIEKIKDLIDGVTDRMAKMLLDNDLEDLKNRTDNASEKDKELALKVYEVVKEYHERKGK